MARMLRPYSPENVIGDFSSGQTVTAARAPCSTAAGTSSKSGAASRRTGRAIPWTTRSDRNGSRRTRRRWPTSACWCSRSSTAGEHATWLNYWKLRRRAGFGSCRHRAVPRGSPAKRSTRRRARPATRVSCAFAKGAAGRRLRRSTKAASTARCATVPSRPRRGDEGRSTGARRASDPPPVRFAGLKPPRSRWPSAPSAMPSRRCTMPSPAAK